MGGGGGWKVIIVSALSLSLIDKERFGDWEIERAWQHFSSKQLLVKPKYAPKQKFYKNIFSGLNSHDRKIAKDKG